MALHRKNCDPQVSLSPLYGFSSILVGKISLKTCSEARSTIVVRLGAIIQRCMNGSSMDGENKLKINEVYEQIFF